MKVSIKLQLFSGAVGLVVSIVEMILFAVYMFTPLGFIFGLSGALIGLVFVILAL